jgi:hypothetical protein
VVDRVIVGTGGDPEKLRCEIGRLRGIDSERVAVVYID